MVRLSTGRSMLATSNIESDSVLLKLRLGRSTPLSQAKVHSCKNRSSLSVGITTSPQATAVRQQKTIAKKLELNPEARA